MWSKLEKKILKTSCGCWLWIGSYDKDGYGDSRHSNPRKVHRASYEYHKGATNGKLVCHTCDTPACVNPEHLFLASHKENTADMLAKGRGKYGHNKPCTWKNLSYKQKATK